MWSLEVPVTQKRLPIIFQCKELVPNPLVLLIQFEKIDGEPLPESLLTPRHISMFCVQYSEEYPYNLEFLNPYEVCTTFSENVVVSVIAGRLMNVSLWHNLNIIVGCTIIPRGRVDAIVTARENVRGPWNEQGEREDRSREQEVRQDDQLKEQVE